jgi:hypothetical protein
MKRLQMPYQFMLRSAAETPEHDYSRTAVAELDIKADAMALVRSFPLFPRSPPRIAWLRV